jgi:signal transduction histidine kinase
MRRALRAFEGVPVRWRIAVTTAGLTLLILVVFALVLGNLVGDRVRDDFSNELEDAAGAIAAETAVAQDSLGEPVISAPRLDDFAMAEDAVISVVDRRGNPLASTDPSMRLGTPSPDVYDMGALRVATEPIRAGNVEAFVQYARPDADVEDTISRLWLFLTAGVLGGAVLALLAGLAVADRAMRPISALTALARDIAATRDPSRRMPVPAADDEVGELAKTMDGMLEALDEATGERERAFERQREFVADASHELRTPLTSVQANLELLQTSLEDPDDSHAAASALASTKRMARLVSDLSLLARADAGRRSARTELDLAKVASGALEEADPLAGDRELRVDLRGPLPIRGNPDELHRLVRNLLENAFRHTPAGATVRLRAKREGEGAALTVEDDGPGIPEELGDQVFERFVRSEGPVDTAGGGGSGLGLAIVRAVAQSHGGEVSAGSSDLGGASFRVSLPLIRFQGADVDSAVDETQPTQRS